MFQNLLIYAGDIIMDNLGWCFKQKSGIKLIEPNLKIAKKYLLDARQDLSSVNEKEAKWNIIKEYYVCYNSLYSLLVKCGIKCEIHDCTIKLMTFFGFNKNFCSKMVDLKKERIDVQYYLGTPKKDYFYFAKEFLEFCEIKFLELSDLQINDIRNELKDNLKKSLFKK